DSILSKEVVIEVKQYFGDQYGNEPNVSVVLPFVGQEVVKNAAMAVAIASVGMFLYVTIRFELFFGITAIIALLHDAVFMLVLFSVSRIEFDVTIVAAILTIIVYSINVSIVTFDRIRENLRKTIQVKTIKEIARIVNHSLLQSFIRSINSSVTTLIAVLAFL